MEQKAFNSMKQHSTNLTIGLLSLLQETLVNAGLWNITRVEGTRQNLPGVFNPPREDHGTRSRLKSTPII